MSSPVKFLSSLAQSLSTMMLYPREHPTWGRAVDASFQHLVELQKENPLPQFSFIGTDVIYGQAPMHDMKDWPWAEKLAAVGVQRLEFGVGVDREEYEEFLADVLSRIVQSGAEGTVKDRSSHTSKRHSIKFGAVAVREEEGEQDVDWGEGGRGIVGSSEPRGVGTPASRTPGTGGGGAGDGGGSGARGRGRGRGKSGSGGDGSGSHTPTDAVGLPFGLEEEAGAVTWMYEQVSGADKVPLVEADAVVRSLTVAMKGSSAMIIPLLRLKASDPYNAIHSINVAVLTMALAEFLGLGSRDVHEFGMAALLHDLGMARIPRDLLLKPIELTVEERTVIERHTTEGARIILSSDRRQELAACVAYEHHLRPDGSGYPNRLFRRPTHYASKLVRVCSVYNALRIERAHRQPYPPGRALVFIDERAGREFETDIATSFTQMMRRLEPQITEVDRDMRIKTPTAQHIAIPDEAIHH
ncbi:MAG TPA: HD domain-containing phosphohydrolase [Gemmatimonadaceae bacterium]